MLLMSSRAVNACQHEDVLAEFGPGLTAVLGPNGSGKTNFINLTRCSVSNDFGSMGAAKEANIRRGCDDDEPAFVESTWQTDAGELVVRRGLRKVHSALFLDGKELTECTSKEKAVTAKAFECLGTTPDILNDFMFADYASLQTVVKGTKSVRAKLFTSLCGMSIIDKADAELRSCIAIDKAVCEQFDQQDLDNETQKWFELRARYRDIRRTIASQERTAASQSDLEEKQEEIDVLSEIAETITNARNQVRVVTDRIRKTKAEQSQAKKDLKYWQLRRKTLKDATRKAGEQVDRFSGASEKVAEVKALQSKKQRAEQKLQSERPAEPKDPGLGDKAEVQKELTKIEYEGKQYRDQLEMIEGGESVCHACHQPVDVSADRKAKVKKQYDDAKAQYKRLAQQLKQVTAYEKDLADFNIALVRWESGQADAKKTIKESSEALEKLKMPENVDGIVQQLKKRSKQLEKFSAVLETAEENETQAAVKLDRCKHRLETAQGELQEHRTTLGDYEMPDAEMLAGLKKDLEEKREERTRLREMKAKMAEVKSAAIDTSKRLRRLRTNKRVMGRREACIEVQAAAREVCKRDRLPARIVNEMLRMTTDKVNAFLEALNTSFKVLVDPDEFSFTAVHSDGYKEPAARLSTGQGLALGIAFWLARSSTFAGRLPLFCFDEPTAHIDETKLTEIANMFALLADELYQSNRQGIVITHHAPIANSATRQLQLGIGP